MNMNNLTATLCWLSEQLQRLQIDPHNVRIVFYRAGDQDLVVGELAFENGIMLDAHPSHQDGVTFAGMMLVGAEAPKKKFREWPYE